MIVALAGRRVDPKDQDHPRFSPAPKSVELVKWRIRDKLLNLQASVLVSSAACGADLLALAEAGGLGLRRRVILPFDRDRFRSTSVTDRPGNWGPLYDAVLDEVQAVGDLVIAPVAPADKAYLETNHIIIEEALSLASMLRQKGVAIRVWEGKTRGEGDLTEEFGEYAQMKGLEVFDVMTK
ncbi:MAG: hypothetical protein WBQ94_19355 [Terracidiphilus sp.]